jgi:allantoin racemase
MEKKSEEEKYLQVAKKAIDEDMAEVIVLGCAGMAGMAETIQHKLGVPVLDGVVCGLIIASGLVKSNISTSKVRKFNPYY